MKSIGICVLALALTPTLALAQTAVGVGTGISESNSASGAVAIAKGGSVNIAPAPAVTTSNVVQSGTVTSNINQRVSGTQTIKSAPSMVAPGLTAAGLETCLGSASGGVSAVGFGITGGSTYKDEDCTARLDSRTLFAMGLKGASVARLCQRPDIWRSMPDVCAKYWPAGVPLPYGIVTVEQAPRITLSADVGAIRVVDGRDGVEKDCLNYSAAKRKCYQWAGESVSKSLVRVAHIGQPQKMVSKPKAPKVEAPKSKVESVKTEPAKTDDDKKS